MRTAFLLDEITQDVREYAASTGVTESEALAKSMEVKAAEFVQQGGEICNRPDAPAAAARTPMTQPLSALSPLAAHRAGVLVSSTRCRTPIRSR
ncbi:MAG: hypothetical protein U1E63_13640 [Burkholderiales bacterium]